MTLVLRWVPEMGGGVLVGKVDAVFNHKVTDEAPPGLMGMLTL